MTRIRVTVFVCVALTHTRVTVSLNHTCVPVSLTHKCVTEFVCVATGEKATLNIAPFFAYGPQGAPPDIPPMSPLTFVIELLAINDKKA